MRQPHEQYDPEEMSKRLQRVYGELGDLHQKIEVKTLELRTIADDMTRRHPYTGDARK